MRPLVPKGFLSPRQIQFSQFSKSEVICIYLSENSQIQRFQIQKHQENIQRNCLLSKQFLKVLLQCPITQS